MRTYEGKSKSPDAVSLGVGADCLQYHNIHGPILLTNHTVTYQSASGNISKPTFKASSNHSALYNQHLRENVIPKAGSKIRADVFYTVPAEQLDEPAQGVSFLSFCLVIAVCDEKGGIFPRAVAESRNFDFKLILSSYHRKFPVRFGCTEVDREKAATRAPRKAGEEDSLLLSLS